MSNSHNPTAIPDELPTVSAEEMLRAAVQERRLTKDYLLSDGFRQVRASFLAQSDQRPFPNYWTALAALGRAASVSKPAETELTPIINALLSRPAAEYTRLSDGEERYYLARCFEIVPESLSLNKAITEVVEEDVAEKARALWVKIAISLSPSKSTLLRSMNNALGNLIASDVLSAETISKKLRRISTAMLEPLIIGDLKEGNDLGSEIRHFYTGHFQGRGPEDRAAREEISLEIMDAAHRIVRLSFAAAVDPALYLIAFDLRQWWRPSSPSIKFDQTARALAQSGMEILHIFARQGIRNKPLRDALERCAGAELFRNLAQSKAKSDSSLDETIAHWLVNGTELEKRRTTEIIENISSASLDEYVGRLLIAASSPEVNSKSLNATAQRIEDLLPDEAAIISSSANRIGQIGQWVRAIARLRSLELAGERGDLVAYDPAVHLGHDQLHIGTRVRLSAPGVIRSESGRPSIQIIKGEVT